LVVASAKPPTPTNHSVSKIFTISRKCWSHTSSKGFLPEASNLSGVRILPLSSNEKGELLQRYQMAPMVASFMEEEDAFQAKQRKAIGVPKGPVEVW
jgi:hypothetical protein